MSNIIFKTEADVTQDWVDYIANEANAEAFALTDQFSIENYIDRETLNPLVVSFLNENKPELDNISNEANKKLSLNLYENMTISREIKGAFSGLKEKIRRTLCYILGESIEGLDIKELIKRLLIALIPAFGAGVPFIVMPIVIGLVAMLIKYGLNYVCQN